MPDNKSFGGIRYEDHTYLMGFDEHGNMTEYHPDQEEAPLHRACMFISEYKGRLHLIPNVNWKGSFPTKH